MFDAIGAKSGLIVIVNVPGVPTHVPIVGVTVMVPEIGVVVGFVPVKVAIEPDPFAVNPIAVFEFAQANVALAGVLVNPGTTTELPLQLAWLLNVPIVGNKLTVISNNSATALQPFAMAFMVTVPTSEEAVAFVAVKVGILVPLPAAANPIPGVELVHETVAVAGVTLIVVAGTLFPGQ